MKDRVFRDPVHGLIEFKGEDRPIAELLDTRAMQRLRRIKQMGFAWLVYPGAEHSRFGHALGAFHIAQRVTRRLELDAGGRAPRQGRRAAPRHRPRPVLARVGARVRRPRSRALGRADRRPRIASSRARSRRSSPACRQTLRAFWGKGYKPHFARKLVSSQLDVDRLDYLLRDGHYSGAGYATYDLDWIIHAIQVADVRTGDDALDLVVDYRRGMYAVEQYLFARSYMYAQVYHHKTVRAAEWMFIKTLERFAQLARARRRAARARRSRARWRAAATVAVDDYLRLHDVSLTTALDRWAGIDGPGADRSGAARSRGAARRSPAVQDVRSRRRPRRRRAAVAAGARGRDAAVRRRRARATSTSTPRARSATSPPTTRSSTSSITRVRRGDAVAPARGHAARPADGDDPPRVRARARRRAAPARRARARPRAWSPVSDDDDTEATASAKPPSNDYTMQQPRRLPSVVARRATAARVAT